LWSVQDYGGSASQASSVVTIGGAGFYEIDSKSSWGHGTYTIKLGPNAPTGSAGVGLIDTGFVNGMRVSNSTGAWMFEVWQGGTSHNVGIDDPVGGEQYDIIWHADSVELQKNGIDDYVVVTDVHPTGNMMFALYDGYPSVGSAQVDYVAAAPVPEPSTLVLLATGSLGLLCYAWRKRK
jgi:hypothetical protein